MALIILTPDEGVEKVGRVMTVSDNDDDYDSGIIFTATTNNNFVIVIMITVIINKIKNGG